MRAALLILSLLWAVVAEAERFTTMIDGTTVAAEEEFIFTRTDSGQVLTGKVRLHQQTGPMDLTYEQQFTSDWSPLRYQLNLSRGNEQRLVEAWLGRGQVRLRVSGTGTPREKTILTEAETGVLDNAIAGHFQALLYRYRAAQAVSGCTWTLAVPQQLSVVTARWYEEEEDPGLLDGKPIRVRHFGLEAGGLRLDLWAEATTLRLMRVSVPLQGTETMREGYTVVPDTASVRPDGYTEQSVTFTSGGYDLPGTLCLPAAGAGRFAAAVIVHGSGPSDRDLTIGPNKPYADLAHGLARHGIASLRYDKRTYVYAARIDPRTLTLDEEVVDDAVAAIRFLQVQPGIDPDAVGVVGHSLGAMLAPVIARRAEHLSGVVMLAAAARPFDELAMDQIRVQGRLNGATEDQVDRALVPVEQFFRRLRDGDAADDEELMGTPASYWRQLLALDVPASLIDYPVPVLSFHGGKDIQVGRADYEQIRAALARRARPADRAEWLPELNHLFMSFDGEPSTATYTRPGHLDPGVITVIADWLTGHLTTAVQQVPGAARPRRLVLEPSFPNPFNRDTLIRYSLPETGLMELALYNLAGQQVAVLAAGLQEAGAHTAAWDGKDQRGMPLASGSYLCRLSSHGQVEIQRLLLLK